MPPISRDPFEFIVEIDKHQNIMIIECRGVFSIDSALQLISVVKQAQDKTASNDNFNRLYDFSSTEFELSVSEFTDILNGARDAFYVPGQKHKVAFVSPDPFVQDLLSLYKTTASRYTFNYVDYFPNHHEALSWLSSRD